MTNDEKKSIINAINSMQRIGLFCEICRNATCICKIGEDSSIINPLENLLDMEYLTKTEMENKSIIERLNDIEDKLNQLILIKKDVLNLKEASEYLKIKESYMYKYTMNNTIKCFRPNGKKIYFKRSDLDNWMLSNK